MYQSVKKNLATTLLVFWLPAMNCMCSEVFLTQSCLEFASDDTGDHESVPPDYPIRIPYSLTKSGNISIPVNINGTNELNLMLHTAVDSISITAEAAKKLKDFHIQESVNVESWGGSAKSGMSKHNRLQIGPIELSNQSVFVDEFSGEGTDGKFGLSIFAGKLIEINSDLRQVIVHSKEAHEMGVALQNYQKIPFKLNKHGMYIMATIQIGAIEHTHELLLHSGYTGALMLDDAFVATHSLASSLPVISQRELKDSFGRLLKTQTSTLPSLRIADFEFRDIPVEIFSGAIGERKISLLGCEILGQWNIIIDKGNSSIYVAPNGTCAANNITTSSLTPSLE